MRMVRHVDGSAALLDESGQPVLELLPAEEDAEAAAALLARLERLLNAPPRIALGLKEGVLTTVQADIACEVVVIEEDPFDTPPLHIRRRPVASGDPDAVTAVIALAEQRQARLGRR
jgi:hypothetical protein